MKRTHKWPAKALNLLVAVAMVISLVAVLAPAVVAQTPPGPNPDPECDPVEQFDGCNLEVFVQTYAKDSVTGDFTQTNDFDEGECFYVNAVVVNTGNVSTADPVSATIQLGGIDVELWQSYWALDCPGNEATQYWDAALDIDDVGGDMADFWWRVCCTDDTGLATITVDVMDEGCVCTASGEVVVNQRPPGEEKCLKITIIEAPGLTHDTGEAGWDADVWDGQTGYPESPFEQTVVPCTNFGIKAKIENVDCGTLSNVNGLIRWGEGWDPDVGERGAFDTEDTYVGALAEIVGGDKADGWCIGTMDEGESAIVAWTLHCEAPGDVEIVVQAEEGACINPGTTLHGNTDYVNIPWTVHQQGAGELNVVIDDMDTEICTTCPGLQDFTVTATVTNSGDAIVTGGWAQLTGNDTALWDFDTGESSLIPFGIDLDPGDDIEVSWDLVCTDPGAVRFTVHAEGLAAGDVVEAEDIVDIWQKEFIASIYEAPTTVNVCQTFDIIGQFENCYQEEDSLTTIAATIWWKGNATLLGLLLGNAYQPMYNRCVPWEWREFDGDGGTAVLNTPVVDQGGGWLSNTQFIPICKCCDTLVRWSFQCLEQEDIEFYVTMEKDVNGTLYDESDHVFVTQEYKAHLIAGLITFLQSDCGAMLARDAFAPCQNFHVVMPVVNVGNETAEDVVMTFTVDPAPSGDTWDIVGITNPVTGDAIDYTFNPTTGFGTVALGDIPGNGMKKAILQLHCAGEGQVQIMILGIVATHANTGEQIDSSNIEIPVCLTAIDQVPFTVEIINPETCETYNPGDRFAVKAVITNDSGTDLGNVSATISWTGNAALVDQGSGGQRSDTYTKVIGNDTNHTLDAYSQAEITWEMYCTAAGEVYIQVSSTALDPYLTTVSQTVNVHQRHIAEIGVEILSPGVCTSIASSETFAVTARVNSTGDLTAENVYAYINPGPNASLVPGEVTYRDLGDMADGDTETVSWTLHCDGTGDAGCGWEENRLYVYVQTTSPEGTANPNNDEVYIEQYPAAHLIATIGEMMPVAVGVCDEFVIPYTIENTGQADAWEASATLSVFPEGSIRIAAGEGGYTQYIGTITGWDTGDIYEGTFTVHCKQACESTITITPAGFDECGWYPAEKNDPCEDVVRAGGVPPYCPCWGMEPGRAIPGTLIEPYSETVKQIDSGGLDLEIAKYVDDANPALEQTVEFTIMVYNYGPTDATGVVVEDLLDAGLIFEMAEAGDYGTYNDSTGVWDLGSLTAGAVATLQIWATVDTTDEIVNTAAITAVDQPDGFPLNDEDFVVLNQEAFADWTINLSLDWNLISLPLIPDDGGNITEFLTSVSANVLTVWAYDPAAGWTSWAPGWGGDLTAMEDGLGYWINMSGADDLYFTGVELPLPPQTPPTYGVAVGWNLIGFKSTAAMTAGDYLNAIAGDWVRIYGFDSGMFQVVQSGDLMQPGYGYWLAAIAAGTIYP